MSIRCCHYYLQADDSKACAIKFIAIIYPDRSFDSDSDDKGLLRRRESLHPYVTKQQEVQGKFIKLWRQHFFKQWGIPTTKQPSGHNHIIFMSSNGS